MDKQEIKNLALKMKSKPDLLKLINCIKKDELQDNFYPYTMKQLKYLCNPNNTYKRFHHFQIPKKSGGVRNIDSPYNENYKCLLRYINVILQSIYEPSSHTFGFVPNKSIVDNASMHIGMNYIYNIDLKDFFPTIQRSRIIARFQVKPFCFTKEIALTIAGLCCIKIKEDDKLNTRKYKYVLSQGFPTSPVLTNIMCDKLDFLLSKAAKKYGINYSRYADDMTFSSMHNVYNKSCNFIKDLSQIISSQGFSINENKVRLSKIGSKQEVTGLTISNDKVNVSRKYINGLRGLIDIWERYGYSQAEQRLNIHTCKENNITKSNKSLFCTIIGKIMFLKMVKGSNDCTYKKLKLRFDNLMIQQKKSQPKHTSLVYFDTITVAQFEEQMKTTISLFVKEGSLHASYMKADKAKSLSVGKNIPITSNKKDLVVSYCCKKYGECGFWHLHLPYISQKIVDETDVDILNVELDNILTEYGS